MKSRENGNIFEISNGLSRRDVLKTALAAGAGLAISEMLGGRLFAADVVPPPSSPMPMRPFGKLDWQVSPLGFGSMRLPTKGGAAIDYSEAASMLHYAIDSGVNYVDTAYMYHGGHSESFVGKALKVNGYRDKVKLATKSPVWMVNSPSDFDKYLDEQLKRLQTDRIDCYLMHALNAGTWKNNVLKYNLLEKAEAAKKAGKIKHIGFSFHDQFSAFPPILNGYDKWDFCMIQYNYMDTETQAGEKGLKMAAEKGIGIVIMEPLLGGRLANPPPSIMDVMNSSGVKMSPVNIAFQWLWDIAPISVILSGMSTMQQVRENVVFARSAKPGSFSGADREVIAKVRAKFKERIKIPCTKCAYCMPCPQGVDIPRNFEVYNEASLYGDLAAARRKYGWFVKKEANASNCIECGACEEHCPQKIKISEEMPKVREVLMDGKDFS